MQTLKQYLTEQSLSAKQIRELSDSNSSKQNSQVYIKNVQKNLVKLDKAKTAKEKAGRGFVDVLGRLIFEAEELEFFFSLMVPKNKQWQVCNKLVQACVKDVKILYGTYEHEMYMRGWQRVEKMPDELVGLIDKCQVSFGKFIEAAEQYLKDHPVEPI